MAGKFKLHALINMLSKKLFYIWLGLTGGFFLLLPKIGQAAILPECGSFGTCGLCDIVQVIVNFGLFLLAISGAMTLLFIVYGGFFWLIAGGSPDRVSKGKNIIINSAIGLAIIFCAYVTIVGFVALVTNNWDWSAKLTCTAPATPPVPAPPAPAPPSP